MKEPRPAQVSRRTFVSSTALAGVALAVGNIDQAAAPPIEGLILMVASPLIYSVWIVLARRATSPSA